MIKMVDTAVPMNEEGYPVARAKHIWLDDDTNLQKAIDDGLIGGGGDSSVTLTQQEYEALSEEQKLGGLYYTYDTKRIYKNGVQYGASDAEGIGYNNAESGIQATTVQGAIDKVVKKVDGLISDTTSSTTSTWSSQKTSSKIAEKIDKTNVLTTASATATDEQVYSAKAINELNLQGTLIDQSVVNKYGTEIIKYPLGRWHIGSNDIAMQFSDIPCNKACIIDITTTGDIEGNPWDNTWRYRIYKARTIEEKGNFVRQLESRATAGVLVDTGWQKVCTTSVADVPMTTVSLDSSKFSSGSLRYEVKNGVCYVYITDLNTEATFKDDSMNSILMPMPSSGLVSSPIVNETTGATVGLFYINSDYFGLMPRCRIFTSPPHKGYTTLSYPVAES